MATNTTEEPTPPGYEAASSSQQTTTDSLPIYNEEEHTGSNSFLHLRNALANTHRDRAHDVEIWQQYIKHAPSTKTSRDETETLVIRNEFISAIDHEQIDVIRFLIGHDFVTADSARDTRLYEQIPLLRAVFNGKAEVVRTLVDLGADTDVFGSVILYGEGKTPRTPLQLAATLGNLVIVKILVNEYHCDDTLVALDGQIALRLAAQNGHRDVVDFLPARRGGGFLRWKHKNQDVLKRIKKAGKKIWSVVRALAWDIPKIVLWSIPKYLVVAWAEYCVWCWEHRKYFGPWCKKQALKMPGRIAGLFKGCWEFGTKTLPRGLIKAGLWVLRLLMVRLPKAIGILGLWMVKAVTSTSRLVWRAVLRVISLLSTIVEVVVTFFQRLTLRDVWNGVCDVLKAVFVACPRLAWSWIAAFGEGSYKIMQVLLGVSGEVIWYTGYGVGWLALYLPRQMWKILEGIGASLSKAAHEVKVWVNPKAS